MLCILQTLPQLQESRLTREAGSRGLGIYLLDRWRRLSMVTANVRPAAVHLGQQMKAIFQQAVGVGPGHGFPQAEKRTVGGQSSRPDSVEGHLVQGSVEGVSVYQQLGFILAEFGQVFGKRPMYNYHPRHLFLTLVYFCGRPSHRQQSAGGPRTIE